MSTSRPDDLRDVTDIVFDLGGVLVDWDPRHLFVGARRENPERVERFLTEVCSRDWHETLDEGHPFETAKRRLIDEAPDYEPWIRAYVDDWESMFAGEFGAVVELLRDLAATGYRLHALSNYPGERIRFLYRRYPFMQAFHSVVISGLIGSIKPRPEVFRYLLDRIGVSSCIFLDDSPPNVAAARDCGIHAFLVRGRGDGTDLDRVREALRCLPAED